MIIRQGLNFAVHLLGGMVVGALAVAALSACRHRGMGETDRDRSRDGRDDDAYTPPVAPIDDTAAPNPASA